MGFEGRAEHAWSGSAGHKVVSITSTSCIRTCVPFGGRHGWYVVVHCLVTCCALLPCALLLWTLLPDAQHQKRPWQTPAWQAECSRSFLEIGHIKLNQQQPGFGS